ncbi:MAG: glycine zipper family protein [Alphaproteobacteria bacterium]|nr:glycine zipper family protein [Alphaproteobacteria bacterium]
MTRCILLAPPLAAGLLLIAGCSSAPSPVLYPNARLNEVGQAQANQDIEACKQMAAAGGANPAPDQAGRAARGTAVGGAAGGATGAVGGAVLGNAGRGAAFGAATGATAGLMRSIFSRPKPSGAYMNFVNRCLSEKGYEPVGWD